MSHDTRANLLANVEQNLPDILKDKALHASTAEFSFGCAKTGYYLVVCDKGWAYLVDGALAKKQDRLASPISNLQAAAEMLRS